MKATKISINAVKVGYYVKYTKPHGILITHFYTETQVVKFVAKLLGVTNLKNRNNMTTEQYQQAKDIQSDINHLNLLIDDLNDTGLLFGRSVVVNPQDLKTETCKRSVIDIAKRLKLSLMSEVADLQTMFDKL